jgi:hypothetical protein
MSLIIPLGGVLHRIDGYVAVDWTRWDEMLVALYLFGSIKLGINLPEAWTQNDVWDVTGSRIVGGHDVPCVKAEVDGITIASWARLYKITKAAFTSRRWLSEAYSVLSPDWYAAAQRAPNLIDAAALRADLAKLGGGTIPDIDPGPAPPAPPEPPPGPGPVPPPAPAALFPLIFPQTVRKGKMVRISPFRAPVDIPGGRYGVVPETARGGEECEAYVPEPEES